MRSPARPNGTAFAGFEDEVTDLELDGDDLYLLVNKGTPRGRIVKTSAAAPNIADGTVVVPQHAPFVIESIAARARWHVSEDHGRRHQPLAALGTRRQGRDIALPFDGTIGAVFTVRRRGRRLDLAVRAGSRPPASGRWTRAGHLADTGITPKPAIDVSAYEAKRFFATAKDGVKIPYTLIYRKGMKLDGSHPAWISAYGSYGIVGLHADLCRTLSGAGGCRRHRGLCQCTRRRRIRPRMAQGRTARQQAQHLARSHRRVRRAHRQEIHLAAASRHRRPIRRRHHRGHAR